MDNGKRLARDATADGVVGATKEASVDKGRKLHYRYSGCSGLHSFKGVGSWNLMRKCLRDARCRDK